MVKDGSRKERLGRDSFKNFNSCSLCLQTARDPRVCTEGHLFCQECIVTSLLAQKKDIKRQNILLERMRKDSEDELVAARAAARERVLREFESAQTAIGAKKAAGGSAASSLAVDKNAPGGLKRKFELDEDEVDRLAEAETEKALSKITSEAFESRKAKLPNFWLPSLTPSATPESVLDTKLQTLCQVAKPSHPISLKSLTAVKFAVDDSDQDKVKNGEAPGICPSCRKSLTNNSKIYVIRPCGDVVCQTCKESLCEPDKACSHCGEAVAAKNGFIELKREGTGYAAGGQVEAKRYDLAFQG